LASGVPPAPAGYRSELSAVGNLLRRQPFPTLGEIAWAVASDIKWAPYRMPTDEYLHWHDQEYYPFLWELLDEKFDNRFDYRLWRLIAKSDYPSKYSTQWPSVFATALEAVKSPEDVIVWGALAVLSGFLTSKRLRELFPDKTPRAEIATQCERRILAGLDPVREGEVGCALIEVLTWSAIQQAQHEFGQVFTLDAAKGFFDRLERSLCKADPNWQPGSIVFVGEALKREQTSGRVVAPYDDVELQVRLAEALFKARAVARSTVRVLDEQADQLLKRAGLLAFSSWRFTRSLRIGEEKFQRENPTYVPEYDTAALRRNEMVALKRLNQALRDAGFYLDAAFTAWLLLTLLPDELLTDPEFRNIGTQLAGVVRNAGLTVPARFARPKEENRRRAKHHAEISIVQTGEEQSVTSTERANAGGKPERVDPFDLRLAEQQKTDARWQEIQRIEKSAFRDPFGALARVVDRRRELAGDGAALRAAFGLCLKYARLREAAQVAACLQLDKDELLDFAHSIKRALQLNLLAVDYDTHAEWRETLRASWTRLPNRATLSGDERLVLHEVLLGRYPSILRNAKSEVSRTLALKLYNRLDDEAVQELLDIGPRAFQRGLATVTIHNLQRSLREMQVGSLGTPVCVSVVQLSDDSVSLIAVGPEAIEVEEIPLSWIHAAPAEVRSSYGLWIARRGNRAPKLRIPWHSTLRKLRGAIIDLVRRIDRSCRWLALALEPDLASLPWTSLILEAAGDRLGISLVPSLSWFARANERAQDTETALQTPTLNISRERDLSEAATRIKRDAGLFQELIGSCGIVLGHGQTTDKAIPSVTIGEGAIALDEWLGLAAHRVVILHSCHSGRVSQSFPSDLGGLPGLALSIGCRLFFAPVTDVPLDAAIALHEELVRRDGPAELGLRYIAATQKNPAVTLYNMFGFANEKVKPVSLTVV